MKSDWHEVVDSHDFIKGNQLSSLERARPHLLPPFPSPPPENLEVPSSLRRIDKTNAARRIKRAVRDRRNFAWRKKDKPQNRRRKRTKRSRLLCRGSLGGCCIPKASNSENRHEQIAMSRGDRKEFVDLRIYHCEIHDLLWLCVDPPEHQQREGTRKRRQTATRQGQRRRRWEEKANNQETIR